MCQFESYYFEDDGYVIRCKECGNFQIAYGNAVLSLTPKQLFELHKRVKKCFFDSDLSLSERSKSITIPIFHFGYYLIFTRKELSKFYNILEIVDTEVKVKNFLNLFN